MLYQNLLFDKVKLKRLVWSLVNEIFRSVKLEEIKQRLGSLLEMAFHDVVAEHPGGRKENDEMQTHGGGDQRGVFLEEEMLISMLHKGRDESCNPNGAFETSIPIGSMVGPFKKSVKVVDLPLGATAVDNL